jgi:polysaccharide pyruvyl transferase WcaK-like protein
MQPTRIVFYGNFGAGNLGNECTLLTAIEQTRGRLPQAQLLCVCPEPHDVQTRHGIAAVPSLSRRFSWSWSDLEAQRSENRQGPATRESSAPRRGLRKLGARLARLGRVAFRRVPQELSHWYRMLRVLARNDVLVIPGTGIVTDANCGSLGWPYDMFKLTVLARLCGVRVVFLSVGAGPFRYRLGCWFIRRTLGLAHYRSYRDVDSRLRLEKIGFDASHDAVYPDLVFGLSRDHLDEPRTDSTYRRIVGLGLKDYATPVDDSDAQSYRAYQHAMADFVVWLQARGHAVRLIIGDAQYDTRVREDLIDVLRARGAAAREPLLLSDPVPTVDELVRQLAETDAVVSPRFHNLVLGLMLNKPVIALSDLPKVTALLTDLGLEAYCLPLRGLTSGQLTDSFIKLQSDAGRLKPYIKEVVDAQRRSVDDQYEKVYGTAANPFGLSSHH